VAVRVLGVDPGLTRCGVGVVEGALGRPLALRHVQVVRTPTDLALTGRLLHQSEQLRALIREHRPDVVAIERMFSQHNLRTVMGTAQSSAMAVLCAAEAGVPVVWHTPTEVKAAVTGTGAADKAAVAKMVVRILRLDATPRPVDATDALALAICQVWRGSASSRIAEAVAAAPRARIPSATGVRGQRPQPAPRPAAPGASPQADRTAALAAVRAGARPSVRRAP
jgi:crossover junction endodeoxyribonuclease RuvC